VFEVIQTVFGEALRVNYIIDPSVKGRVNFRTTTPIPKDRILPVMEIILRLNGIAVVEEAGLYRIIPIGNISKEPAPIRFGKAPESVELRGIAIMQIVPLTHINSTEMAAILTPLLTQGGAIHDISKRNMLIVADTDSNVRRLLQVVATFDNDPKMATNQPKIYVYQVQNSKAKNVSDILNHLLLGGTAPSGSSTSSSTSGVKTTSGTSSTSTSSGSTAKSSTPRAGPVSTPKTGGASGDTLVAPTTKIYPDENNNTLVILATPSDYSVIISAVRQIDLLPRQVMIEAMIASVTLEDNLTFGLKWNTHLNYKVDPVRPFSKVPQVFFSDLGFQNVSAVSSSSFGYTVTDKAGNVKLAIEAMAYNDKAKVLSAPHLLVADNKEAKIQVGQQVPLATSTTTTPGTILSTTTTTSTIQYKDTGTILTIKPQINDSGMVSIELSQEVSSADLTTVLGTDQYVITKNEVKTNLVVHDGETIIIGGLVSENITINHDGIPILNKIPVINLLAGSTSDKKKRQELVILLTPRVIKNPGDALKLSSDYNERFRNVEKELNLKKHFETFPSVKPAVAPGTATPAAQPQPPKPQNAQPAVPATTPAQNSAKPATTPPQAPVQQKAAPAAAPAKNAVPAQNQMKSRQPAAAQTGRPADKVAPPKTAVPAPTKQTPAAAPVKSQAQPAQASPIQPAAQQPSAKTTVQPPATAVKPSAPPVPARQPIVVPPPQIKASD
jgi:general secretion pathway protein D